MISRSSYNVQCHCGSQKKLSNTCVTAQEEIGYYSVHISIASLCLRLLLQVELKCTVKSHLHSAPPLTEVILCFKRRDTIKIRNRISFNFYSGLPHDHCTVTCFFYKTRKITISLQWHDYMYSAIFFQFQPEVQQKFIQLLTF